MGSNFTRNCVNCGNPIRMVVLNNGKWLALDFPDRTDSGDWELHNKGGRC